VIEVEEGEEREEDAIKNDQPKFPLRVDECSQSRTQPGSVTTTDSIERGFPSAGLMTRKNLGSTAKKSFGACPDYSCVLTLHGKAHDKHIS
jgi:hypothetical protein